MVIDSPAPNSQKQTCASCKSNAVKAFLRTTQVVYLRCMHCRHIWSIAERRQVPRSDDDVRQF